MPLGLTAGGKRRSLPWFLLTAAVMVALIVFFRPHQSKDQTAGGPALSARDVINAADRSGGGVAPGEVVILHPSNAGPADIVQWQAAFPTSAGYTPHSLGTTLVY